MDRRQATRRKEQRKKVMEPAAETARATDGRGALQRACLQPAVLQYQLLISATQRYGKRPSDGRKARRTWSAAAQKQQPPPPLKPPPESKTRRKYRLRTPRIAPPQRRIRQERPLLRSFRLETKKKHHHRHHSQSKTSPDLPPTAKRSQNWLGAIKPLPLHKTQIGQAAACNSVSRVKDREIDEMTICACSATSRRRPCPVPDQTGWRRAEVV